ncbi:MucBP domain-containing protein [Leuconostoc citreum]|uniref:MucBP domain-containing protein n=1 Tax=Leuconostoc citreum TaxID=33964 RepID=UPI0032DF77AA
MIANTTVNANSNGKSNVSAIETTSIHLTTENSPQPKLNCETRNDSSEKIDDWMPDKNLQTILSYEFRKPVSLLKKSDLQNKDLYVEITSNVNSWLNVRDLKGLENLKSLNITVQDVDIFQYIDYSKYDFLKENGFFYTYGDLRKTFPNNIDITKMLESFKYTIIDPHNFFLTVDKHVNEDNYKEFSITYKDIGLLNVNKKFGKIIKDSSAESSIIFKIGGKELEYTITYNDNGIDFKLENNVNYSDIVNQNSTSSSFQTAIQPESEEATAITLNVNNNMTLHFDSKSIISAKVTAKYVDEQGNAISDNTVLYGNLGEAYQTERKSIAGYTFKAVEGNTNGAYSEQEQTVTYVYTKDAVKPSKPKTPTDTGKQRRPRVQKYSQRVKNSWNSLKQGDIKKSASQLLPKTAAQKSNASMLNITLVGLLIIIFFVLKKKINAQKMIY